MKKIINLNGTLVELDKIKGILINTDGYFDIKLKSNFIKIELLARKEYIINPANNEYEIHDFNDVILVEFPDYAHAMNRFEELKEVWEEYINE